MKRSHTLLTLLAATLLLGSPAALAEDAAATAPRRAGGAGGGGPMQSMTDEQRQAMQQVSEETKELNTKLTEARKELGGAIYAEKVDEAAIREKAATVAKIDADLYVARAKAFAKVRSKFTPEQIEAFKSNPGGNFDISAFTHRSIYNRDRHRIEMHLISRKAQSVRVLGHNFSFRPGESIHTESSYKYSLERFTALARGADWKVRESWTDKANMFSVHALAASS